MDSPQSVVSPFKGDFVSIESRKQNANATVENSGIPSREINFQAKEISGVNLDNLDGVVEIYIHEARDIHNICIYQKQDVYAKFSLTCDLENAVSTKIINGGGRNPVFNEILRLNVSKIDSSLKCELWMLSRVRNYLEDQLLGFALVPVSYIFLHNGKLEKEFSLSSTDLFHSPSGFVRLTVTYIGAQPEVVPISSLSVSLATGSVVQDGDMEKIEFPDPKVVNENRKMVEEYFAMPFAALESDTENHEVTSEDGIEHSASSLMGTSVNGTSSASPPVASSQFCETPKALDFANKDQGRLPLEDNSKETKTNGSDSESDASAELSSHTFSMPTITINMEPEPKVVQQEIVDMYMKSMQQFTESLAKMKLPMDFETEPTGSDQNSSSGKKSPASKSSGSRVFYGSRAFF